MWDLREQSNAKRQSLWPYKSVVFLGGRWTNVGTNVATTIDLVGQEIGEVLPGDLIVGAYATGATADRTLSITDGTNPYTLIASELWQIDTRHVNLRVAYKLMGTTPDTSITFGAPGNTGEAGAMLVLQFRNVSQTSPIGSTATALQPNSVLVNPAAVTPTTVGSLAVFVGGGANDLFGNYTGLSSIYNQFNFEKGNSTIDAAIFSGVIPYTGGTIDPGPCTFDQTDSANWASVAVSFVVNPEG